MVQIVLFGLIVYAMIGCAVAMTAVANAIHKEGFNPNAMSEDDETAIGSIFLAWPLYIAQVLEERGE